MRIVMPILEYHPITGGAQRQIATVAPLLQAGGAHVEVWTRAVPGQPRAEEIAGVPVRRLGRPGRAATASFVAEAAARLALDRPDVVHAYSLFSPAALALFATRALGIPSVVKILRGGRLGDAERLQRKPFGAKRAAALARGIDCFLAISREIEGDLDALAVPPERRRFLPNGVDLERFAPLAEPERSALRAQLGFAGGPLAVYLGRLVPEKRVEDLLVAWREVRRELPTAELAVLGTGSLEGALRSGAPPGVRFCGDVADPAATLRAADAFVLPSSTEGLSNALLEAMAAGLPAIATAVGGAVDLIDDGANGRLFAPGDTRALAAALGSLLADRALGERLGARARERVAERYALPIVAERLLHLYRELADAPLVRPLTTLAATKQ